MHDTTSSPQRKLAAIMFTDIAGYTAAMSADEESALKTLRKKRSILKPLITDNNGTFVKEIGDGTLSYFRSAIDAATCAVSLQQATYDDADMNLRIGVHVGDIVFDDEDVFGDGVNVAARLESMAPVGGVCVSKSVFEELLNKKEFDGIPLGLQQLKGVGRLIDVFALKAKNLIHPDPKEYEEHKVEPHTGDEVPSVAVLPLKNKGKEEDAFYAYGITADLITGLSSAGKIRVVSMDDIATAEVVNLSSKEAAKKLDVRYIVNGMLWKHEDMFQLSIEMDDTNNNSVLWSDRWQEQWEELTTIKGKLAENLLKALNISVGKIDTAKTIQTNTEAYEFYLRGKYKYQKRQNFEDIEIARGLYKKAIELDDGLLVAKSSLGWSYYESGDYDRALELYSKAKIQAEKLDYKSDMAQIRNGIGSVHHGKGNFGKALQNYRDALNYYEEIGDRAGIARLNNNIGIILFSMGDIDKTIECFNNAFEIRKELRDRRGIGNSLLSIGRAYTEQGIYEEALKHITQSIELFEEFGDKQSIGWSLDSIGKIYYQLCYFDRAMDYKNRSLEIKLDLADTTGVGFSYYFIGQIYFSTGEYEKALKYYHLSIDELEIFGHRNRQIGTSKAGLGRAYYHLGPISRAIECLNESLEIQKTIVPRDEDLQLEITTNLFLSYKQMGKEFDLREIVLLIEKVENIEYELNYGLFELLDDKSYLEAAYKQVHDKAESMENEISEKFLNYPIPKVIIESWKSIQK